MVEIALRLSNAEIGPGTAPEPDAVARDPAPARPGAPTGARWFGLELALMVGGMALAGAVLTSTYEASLEPSRVFSGVKVGGRDVGGLDRAELELLAEGIAAASTARPTTLVAGDVRISTTPAELGAVAAPSGALDAALRVGRTGDPWSDLRHRELARRGEVEVPVGLRFREQPALERLTALASTIETPSLPTRLDLGRRRVLPAQRGMALLPQDSLSSVAIGLAAGHEEIELAVQSKPPIAEDRLASVAEGLDIGVALGSFSTSYHNDRQHAARNHNLKLGAAALDGLIVMPGETFSFNDIVGPRSAEAGYRYAPGITAGEIVDELGGGICQVASSLFGAAFFAGLDVVSARPHSRPSSYVDMGLDATVVYGMIDLRLRNPYDFPVVVHMSVSDGTVDAEILGARRPYQIAFSRKLEQVLDYETVVREDARYRVGTRHVAQRGMRGFTVTRERSFIQGGEVVQTESWRLDYPPTREIVEQGVSPDGEVPEAVKLPPLRDPRADLEITQ